MQNPQRPDDWKFDPSRRDRAVSASRTTRERMLQAMHVLEAALARPAPRRRKAWRSAVAEVLKELEVIMQHQSGELSAQDGLMDELLHETPRLENRIQQLRHQYQDLLHQIRSLYEEFTSEEQTQFPDIADIRQRLSWLVVALRHFQSRETDLVYEAIQVDIGDVD